MTWRDQSQATEFPKLGSPASKLLLVFRLVSHFIAIVPYHQPSPAITFQLQVRHWHRDRVRPTCSDQHLFSDIQVLQESSIEDDVSIKTKVNRMPHSESFNPMQEGTANGALTKDDRCQCIITPGNYMPVVISS